MANSSLRDRVTKARSTCFDPKITYYNNATFNTPHPNDFDLYTPSNTQRMLTPVYVGIIDQFGGVVQGLIENGEARYATSYLRKLGNEAKTYMRKKYLNKLGAICLASCITNKLMESDESIFPTTSLPLALSNGKGFCRHFSLSTLELLKRMGIKAKAEYSFRHMFIKLNYKKEALYFDPSVSEGTYSCNFIKANKVIN